jgi:hypothetical protein
VAGRLTGRAAAILPIALLGAACGDFLPSPIGAPTDPPFGSSIDVANGTTLTIEVWVNGVRVGSTPGRTDRRVLPDTLPAQPWHVEARTVTGRVLLQFEVQPGQVTQSTSGGVTTVSGAGSRADLSCGRLDVTVGPPMLGPAPDPGVPGDCLP